MDLRVWGPSGTAGGAAWSRDCMGGLGRCRAPSSLWKEQNKGKAQHRRAPSRHQGRGRWWEPISGPPGPLTCAPLALLAALLLRPPGHCQVRWGLCRGRTGSPSVLAGGGRWGGWGLPPPGALCPPYPCAWRPPSTGESWAEEKRASVGGWALWGLVKQAACDFFFFFPFSVILVWP